MKDERLINELEKVFTDEAYDGGMGALSDQAFSDMVRGLAVKAADVVAEASNARAAEKAHTPTDDERKALKSRLEARAPYSTPEAHGVAQRSLAAGFRRSEVPEPSIEDEVDETAARYQPCHFDESGMYAKTWCHTHGQDHITPDGDVWVNGFDLGDGQTYTGPISPEDLFAARPDPQGEPSDAQVQAALKAWTDYWDRDEGGSDEEAMCESLRAAGEA